MLKVVTVKRMPLDVTEATCTYTLPDMAPDGTFTVNVVALALKTDAATVLPLLLANRTVFVAGVNPNPEPEIVTVEPIGPLFGVKFEILTLDTPPMPYFVKCVTSADAMRPDGSTTAVNSLGSH